MTLRAVGTALDALRAEGTVLLERLHRTANELNDARQKIWRRLTNEL